LAALDKDVIHAETMPLMDLFDAGNIAQRAMEKRLSHLGLSVAQQRIITLVYLANESLTPSGLAALLLQETHSVSGLLNRLEDRELITRFRDKRDRRVVWVGLSGDGQTMAEKAIEVAREISRELAPVLSRARGNRAIEALRAARDIGFKIAGVKEEVRREALRRVWGK